MTFKRFVNGLEIVVLVAVAVFVVMLFANEPGGTGGSASGSPGQQIYEANCASCHGGDGGGGIGPQLSGGAVVKAFPDAADQVALVKSGRDGMPSFKGDLTDEQIQQVVDYTRTDLGG